MVERRPRTARIAATGTEPSRGERPLSRAAWIAASFALLAGAFVLDYVTGNEVASSLFYMVGIAVAAWCVGERMAVVLACLSAASWATTNQLLGPAFSKLSIFVWNIGAELVVYLTTGIVLARIQEGLKAERQLVEQLNVATAALTREAQAVGELQREMLPTGLPEVPGYEWLTHYMTSSDAGGDYYDFFALPGGKVGVFVGDASGHGAQAAVLMAMMRVLLHTTAEALTSPGAVLARLGHQIAQTIPDGRFATACYVVLDPASGRIDFSLAGHPPPLILRATGGAPDELPLTGGPPLGLIVEGQFDAGVETLRPGDTLVLYTDGLTESASPSQELFGDVRLKHALRGAEALSLVELRARILARLEAHTSGAGLEDDLTLLLLRRQPVQASR